MKTIASITVAIAAITIFCNSSSAQRIETTIGDTSQYTRIEQPLTISAMIEAKEARRATAAEVARINAGNRAFQQSRDTRQPMYMLLNDRALSAIADAQDTTHSVFIVPAMITGRYFGRNAGTFLTPTGGCLEGMCGPCAPTAGRQKVTQSFGPEMIPMCAPAVPNAPPAPTRRR